MSNPLDANTRFDLQYKTARENRHAADFGRASNWLLEQLVRYSSTSVLDLGCGHGLDMIRYSKLGFAVCGVDISEELIEEAKASIDHPWRAVCASATDLPFTDGSFDAVVSRYVIHHISELRKVYSEVSRVLEPGGIFAFVVPHPAFVIQTLGGPDVARKYHSVMYKTFNGRFPVIHPKHGFNDYMCLPNHNSFRFADMIEYGEANIYDVGSVWDEFASMGVAWQKELHKS